jgi:ABC-type uncharacterized transport system substrate-binding protein
MRRREFIVALGSAAAWPLSAPAQQPAMPVVGWLNSGPAGDPFFMSLASAFRAGLKDAGYNEGQNVAIDFRWGEGQYNRLPTLAAELVAKRVDAIIADGPPAALAAKAATQTIPIIFTSGEDPVRQQSIPTMFSLRAAAADGGLMSYGIDFADGYRQAGIYVSRVLKGEKPGDLPVIRSTKFELVINLATAKQLGLTIPSGPLSIADEVIE